MGKLKEQVRVDLQLMGITPRTQHIYLREMSNLANYFNKSPEQLKKNELKEYLLYLLKKRNLSQGTSRFYVSGLRFLYRTTLKRKEVLTDIQFSKRKKALPAACTLLTSGTFFGGQVR